MKKVRYKIDNNWVHVKLYKVGNQATGEPQSFSHQAIGTSQAHFGYELEDYKHWSKLMLQLKIPHQLLSEQWNLLLLAIYFGLMYNCLIDTSQTQAKMTDNMSCIQSSHYLLCFLLRLQLEPRNPDRCRLLIVVVYCCSAWLLHHPLFYHDCDLSHASWIDNGTDYQPPLPKIPCIQGQGPPPQLLTKVIRVPWIPP